MAPLLLGHADDSNGGVKPGWRSKTDLYHKAICATGNDCYAYVNSEMVALLKCSPAEQDTGVPHLGTCATMNLDNCCHQHNEYNRVDGIMTE